VLDVAAKKKDGGKFDEYDIGDDSEPDLQLAKFSKQRSLIVDLQMVRSTGLAAHAMRARKKRNTTRSETRIGAKYNLATSIIVDAEVDTELQKDDAFERSKNKSPVMAIKARSGLFGTSKKARRVLLLMGMLLKSTQIVTTAERHIVLPEKQSDPQAHSNGSIEIHDWALLRTSKDVLSSATSGDALSLEYMNDLNAKFTALSQLYEVSIGDSVENDIDRLTEVAAVVSTLQAYFEVEDIPTDGNFLPTIKTLLAKASRSLMHINGLVQDNAGIESNKRRKGSANGAKKGLPIGSLQPASLDVKTLDDSISESNDHLQTDYTVKRTSSSEFVLRARGHHGFMAEDKKIHSVLHAPGGRGVNMHDSSYSSSSFDGFNVNGFLGGSFHRSSFDSGLDQRRLVQNGVCVEPDEEVLKWGRCARLAECVKKFTVSDLLTYYYGDDMSEQGEFDKKEEGERGETTGENVKYFDEEFILDKFDRIQGVADEILADVLNYSAMNDSCDSLLDEFHRYDETKPKWVGGSVTSICRSWGTTKKANLQSVYDFISPDYFWLIPDSGDQGLLQFFTVYRPGESFLMSWELSLLTSGFLYPINATDPDSELYFVKTSSWHKKWHPMFLFNNRMYATIGISEKPFEFDSTYLEDNRYPQDYKHLFDNGFCDSEWGKKDADGSVNICVTKAWKKKTS
jgi:hypothetical protein